MKQVINLINSLPVKEKVRLPANTIAAIVGIFLLILVVFYGFVLWQKHGLKIEITSLKVQEQQAADRLLELSKKYPKVVTDTELAQEVLGLGKKVTVHKEIIAILQKRKDLNLVGFSNYLQAFSKTITPDAWLTSINVSDAGEDVELEGQALNTSSVLTFVSNLNGDSTFTDRDISFDIKSMKQGKQTDGEKDKYFTFVVTTHEQDNDDKKGK